MPAVVIIVIHAAFTVYVNDPVRFLRCGEHCGNIRMTTLAIRIAVVGCIV